MLRKRFGIKNKIKIAIINLTAGGISGGYRKYLENILPRMAVSNGVEEILCATPPTIDIQSWFSFLPKVNFISCKPFNFINYVPERELKKALKMFSPDVIFIPVERYFKFDRVPMVNMIQNMEPFTENIDVNSFTDKGKLYIQRLVAKRAIKKSDRVIAISKHVKNFLLNKWNIPEGKIGLVYHGIELPGDEELQLPQNMPKDWKGKFIFTAGSIRPARGLEDMLQAMKYLPLKKAEIKGLVIAGGISPNMISYLHNLKKWIQAQNLSPKIFWASSLNEKEMGWCYRNCKIFAMTSRVEACPNIALEAMSYGCISVSSNNPPLPEIFDEAAIYYPPKNGKLLAEAIKSVSEWGNHRRGEALKKARERAVEFSWDVTVERLLTEFKKAIERIS